MTFHADVLREQANLRAAQAVTEGLTQFGNGWTPAQVLAVLHDAAGPIADLRQQADQAEQAES